VLVVILARGQVGGGDVLLAVRICGVIDLHPLMRPVEHLTPVIGSKAVSFRPGFRL
jgi:hypothetical protein